MKATAEKELREVTLLLGKAMLSLAPDKFRSWASSLNNDVVELLLEKHRADRNFYKRITQEERRKDAPQALRYQDAEKKLRKYNEQGKILKQIVESFKT